MKNLKILVLFLVVFLCVSCASATTATPKTTSCEHDYNSSVIKEKSCTEDGLIRYICSKCGDIKEEVIPKGHRYYYQAYNDESHKKVCLDCGDEVFESHTLHKSSIGTEDEIIRCMYCNDGLFPRIDIRVSNRIVKDDYVDCLVTTSNYDEDLLIKDAECSIKVRGNATANYNKKPYRLKFKSKQSMFGLNDGLKAKSWVLLAGYIDKTLMNDALGFYLSENILDGEYYSSDYKYVEVYINGAYNGLYLLAEQQQINKGRFDINEVEKNDTSVEIGYLLELDYYYYDEDYYIQLDYGQMNFYSGEKVPFNELLRYYTIKSDIYSNDQVKYVQKWMQNIYNVVYDAFYNDHTNTPYKTLDSNGNIITDETIKSAEECAERVIDVKSMVNITMLMEITENLDIGYSSFYMDIDLSEKGSKKLVFEGPWDFEWTFGNAICETDIFYTGNKYRGFMGSNRLVNPWIILFMNQDWFMNRLRDKWNELEENHLYERFVSYIEDTYTNYHKYFDKNFNKWSECMRHQTFGPKVVNDMRTQEEAVRYLLEYVKNKYTYLTALFS